MLFVDLQGFACSDVLPFTCKEIAIYNSETKEYVHRFINLEDKKDAYSTYVKKTISYQEDKIHGIGWSHQVDNKKRDALEGGGGAARECLGNSYSSVCVNCANNSMGSTSSGINNNNNRSNTNNTNTINCFNRSYNTTKIWNLQSENISEFIDKYIASTDLRVLVKGAQKKIWLQKYLTDGWNYIQDLNEEYEDFNCKKCPSFSYLKDIFKTQHCNQHDIDNDLNCALENAFNLYYWYTLCGK